jgi:two-component system, LuxR family, response regulator FixJ
MSDDEPHKVAVIDDDHGVRESPQFLLEIAGHVVEAFASATDFLKAAMHDLACLIVDHHMPEMTGLDLVERLRADGVRIPVLLMTGAPSPAIIARAAGLGVELVIEKPVAEQDLLNFISRNTS